MACIFDFFFKFYVTGNTLSVGYICLGIVKVEAFDYSNFMHQTVRVCHTDHTLIASFLPWHASLTYQGYRLSE